MNNIKQIVTIATLTLGFIGTVFSVVNEGIDTYSEIKQLKESSKSEIDTT